MNRHEFDIYKILYKRGLYSDIPIGMYPNGKYFYMTKKQVKALELLNDNITTQVGYGGSARCFDGETLINTSKGHKKIKDISIGDYVLSFNVKNKIMEYKKVLDTYIHDLPNHQDLIVFNSLGLKCTQSHEFLFNGNWTKAADMIDCGNRNEYSFIEAREISDFEISNTTLTQEKIKLYDLCVDDNHNYTVTENNIIVHNSGKSVIEVVAIIMECMIYPDIAWGLARKELTTLKRTVLLTLFKQLYFYGFEDDEYNYKQDLNKIIFSNKSEVFLIDTKYKPSDPTNTRFGGFELTRCAIDESNETDVSVINKLFERTGWRHNDKYELKRKQFECFNPDKNHVYSRFYLPFRDDIEPGYRKFIPALPSDNPNPAVQEWVDDIVATGDTATIERQINGNFDYDDDPRKLCDYDAICDMFTNDHVLGGNKYISADLAMKGRDRFVGGCWDGLICKIPIDMKISDAKVIETSLKELKTTQSVPNSKIVADADGLGNYLEAYIKNIKEFRGGSSPVDPKFGILKDECLYKLAEMINKRLIKVECNQEQEELIKQELSVCLKSENIDIEKKRIINKKDQKVLLGRSPDYMDMLMMRMFFELKKSSAGVF